MLNFNIRAVLESIAAMLLYFFIALKLDTHIHLVVSVLVAPLLLLRSELSKREGVVSFYHYVTSDSDIKFRTHPILFLFLSILILTVIIFANILVVQSEWLKNVFFIDKYYLFSLGFILPIVTSLISIFIPTTLVGIRAGFIAGLVSGRITQVGVEVAMNVLRKIDSSELIPVLLVGAKSAEEGLKYNLGWKFVQYSLIAVFLYQSYIPLDIALFFIGVALFELLVKYLNSFSSIVFGSAISLGILIRAILTRIYYSLKFWVIGVRRLPTNFKRVMYVMRVFDEPEVVPDFNKKIPSISADNVINLIRGPLVSGSFKILLILALFTLYIPAIVYRLSLKSTLWFYYTLAFWSSSLQTSKVTSQSVLKDMHEGRWEFTSRLASLVVVSSILITTYSHETFLLNREDMPDAHNLVIGLLAIDVCRISLWHMFSVISALITFIIWAYSDILSNRYNNEKVKNVGMTSSLREVRLLILLSKVRRVFTILFFISAFGFVILNSKFKVPSTVVAVAPEMVLEVIEKGGRIFAQFNLNICKVAG